jgi:acetyltransferase-like isoleucine patch superfamily enzyme
MNQDTEFPGWHEISQNSYNPHAWLVGDPIIGDDCWIGAFTVIDGSGGLEIGRGCDISAGAQIYTHSTVRRVISEGAEEVERRSTRIGDFVHVGAGAVILMGADIGDHCVVAAGAVVTQGTIAPPFSILKGVPAEVHGGAVLNSNENTSDSLDCSSEEKK